jgi:RHS repeat-associated protein
MPRGWFNRPQRRPSAGLPRGLPPVGLRKKVDFRVTIWRRFVFVVVVPDGIMHHHAGQKGVHSKTYVMKTQMKPMIWLVALLALLSGPHLASAYYDPGVQRWINRDPVREPGFQAVKRPNRTIRGSGLNFYLFVQNAPNLYVDPEGLQKVLPDKDIEDCLNNCDWDWREAKRKSISVGWRCAGYIGGAIVGTGGASLCCVGAWPIGLPAAIIGYGFDVGLWIIDERKDEKFDRKNQADWVQCCKDCGTKYPNDKDVSDDHVKRNHRQGPIW